MNSPFLNRPIRSIEEAKADRFGAPLGCPWCGGDPTTKPLALTGTHYVTFCDNDDCPSGAQVIGTSYRDAVTKWNTRADKPVSHIQAMKDAAE